MRTAVPLFIYGGIAQPEVGRHVDDLQALRQVADDDLARRVRQAAKNGLDLGPIGLFVLDEGGEFQMGEMRKHLRHRFAGMRIGGEHSDLDARMARGQSHQIGAGIARSTDDADLDPGHAFSSFDRSAGLSNKRLL